MRTILKMCVATMALICAVTVAEAKSEKQIVTKSFVTTLDCHSCAEKIMKVIPYQKGVKDVVVSVENKSVTVKYDASKNSEVQIIESLKRLDIEVVDESSPTACCEDCK